jgi:hypothetical protein
LTVRSTVSLFPGIKRRSSSMGFSRVNSRELNDDFNKEFNAKKREKDRINACWHLLYIV